MRYVIDFLLGVALGLSMYAAIYALTRDRHGHLRSRRDTWKG